MSLFTENYGFDANISHFRYTVLGGLTPTVFFPECKSCVYKDWLKLPQAFGIVPEIVIEITDTHR